MNETFEISVDAITEMNNELSIIQDRLVRRLFKNHFKETFIDTQYRNTINYLRWRLEKHLIALIINKFINK